jgi:hypothetical protein
MKRRAAVPGVAAAAQSSPFPIARERPHLVLTRCPWPSACPTAYHSSGALTAIRPTELNRFTERNEFRDTRVQSRCGKATSPRRCPSQRFQSRSMTKNSKRSVIAIGGGIGGLAVSLALAKNGIADLRRPHRHGHPLTFLGVSMYMRAVGASPGRAEVVMTDDSQEREAR